MKTKATLNLWLAISVFLLAMVSNAAGLTIYVDNDAPGDPEPNNPVISDPLEDGTTEHPFDAIQEAIDVATHGDTVVVLTGTYTGTGNRDIDVPNKVITIMSTDPNDPNTVAATVIDCNGTEAEPHRGFYYSLSNNSVLSGLTITNGYANIGGGISCVFSSPTIRNCTFSGNWAIGGGGIVILYSSPTLTNCTFNGNSAEDAGGMFNLASSPTVSNCTFSGNSAEEWSGGGISNDNSNPTLTNCTFSGNSAEWNGGGMSNWDNSSPTLTNCTFSGNSAENAGGGMNNGWYSNPTLDNCIFSDNSAQGGGGMFSYQSSPTLTNCTFNGNSAEDAGGMFNLASSPTVSNCTFSENSAGRDGGGMSNWDNSSPTLTNCTFSGNSAVGNDGGGMNNSSSSPTITNCTFNGNSAYDWGGAIRNVYSSSPTITNCTFTGNSADDGGGMFGYSNSSPTLVNCTFTGNEARYGGGMNNWNGSSPTLTNCILWGNTAPSGPQIYNDGTSSATVSYSDVKGSWPGTGNKNADPRFLDVSNGDLRLLPTSPCIDAGDNTAVPAGVTTDLGGNPRFVDQPEVPDTGNGTAPIVDMGAFEADYIKVPMKFTPQALNPSSQGNWIKAHFVLPDGFDVNDVDANTPAMLYPGGIPSEVPMNVFINEDGLVEIEAAFSRSDFCGSATSDDDTEVIVIGLLTSGQNFYGTDTIRIISNNSLAPDRLRPAGLMQRP